MTNFKTIFERKKSQKRSASPLKPEQQANGKRGLEQTRGRLLRLHGPRYLFALFSAACFACTALVIFSFFFRPLTSLARPSLSFRSLFGPRGALLGHFLPLLAHFLPLLGLSWPLSAALGQLLGALGPLLGGSWPLLGRSWPLLGRSWNDMQKSSKNRCQK